MKCPHELEIKFPTWMGLEPIQSRVPRLSPIQVGNFIDDILHNYILILKVFLTNRWKLSYPKTFHLEFYNYISGIILGNIMLLT